MSKKKKNAVVAGRIHMSSQNGKIICRKTARCSGKRHISKSKCQKHGGLRLFWKDTCSTVLGREAHLQVKMHQKHVFGPFLEVHESKNWRACPSQNAHSRPLLETRIGVFRLLFGRSYAEKKPMWQERHFEVKCQNIKVRTTFGGSHPEKNCYCGRKHIGKLKCQRYGCFRHF